MEYIKLSKENQKDIKKVIDTLNKNGVVILPTDTVYGIAADASNEEAVRKIYEVKHRKFTKPCNILVSNIDMIRKVTKNVSPEEEKIMKKYFPGALTMIFDKNDKIPNIVTANLDTRGLRMPNNKFLLERREKYGKPIVATSLNLAGEESYTNVEKIEKTLKNNVDLIVDGGETKIGIPSTIIKIEDKKIRILREGPITKEELQKEI